MRHKAFQQNPFAFERSQFWDGAGPDLDTWKNSENESGVAGVALPDCCTARLANGTRRTAKTPGRSIEAMITSLALDY
jgi:hypothetical protein